MQRYFFAGSVVVFVLATALVAFAQGFQGGVRGAVMDPGGAIIPGVEVSLVNVETNATRTALTNEAGQYVFSAINPGLYRIKASLPGFKTFERQGIRVGTQEFPIIDVSLEVGAVTDEISVVADTPLIETSNASNSQALSAAVLDVLPNPGRNAFIMAQTVPTVVPVGDPTWNRQQDQNGSSSISLAGGPVRGNNYTIDGVSVTDVRNRAIISPSIESIDEVKIQVNTFDSEMGRTGGGVFNTLARGGTNNWHGSGLVQSRPGWGTANNWFANAANIPLNKNFAYWLGGGSLGGPIIKDKTFFWFAGEGYRDDSQLTTTNTTVPSLKQRSGDFSESYDSSGRVVTIYDPLTTRLNPSFNASQPVSATNPQYIRDPFPNNVIQPQRMNPIALALMKYYPNPDTGRGTIDGRQNYVRTAKLKNKARQVTLKLNHQFSSKLSVSAFGSYQKTDEPNPVYYDDPTADSNNYILNRIAKVVAVNGTLTPDTKSVVSFRYGYSAFDDNNNPKSIGFDLGKLGFSSNYVNIVQYKKFPSVSITNYNGLGDASRTQLYYYAQNANFGYSRFMGKHSTKYGFDFRQVGAFGYSPGQGSGSFGFTQAFTRLDPIQTNDTRTGNAFASFLLGYPQTVTMPVVKPIDGYFRYYAGYIQDDVRLSNALTLNMGFRYEYEGGLREKENRITVGFDRTARNPISDKVTSLGVLKGGLIYAGVNGAKTSQGNPTKTKFGPRIGFAWNAPKKFVVRGGYGIFYAPEQYTTPSSTAWAAQGYSITENAIVSEPNSTRPIGSLADPFPTGYRQPQGNALGLMQQLGDSVNFVDDSGKSAYVQQYTLDISHELPGGIAFSMGYVGSWSTNLTIGGTASTSLNINQLTADVARNSTLTQLVPNPFFGIAEMGPMGAQSTIARGQLLRPYPQFGNINMVRVHQGFARYNSMIIKGEKRAANGLTLRANYTWSKNLDNVVGEDNFFASESNSIVDNYNLKNEYGYATIDTPHRVIITPIYALPFGQGKAFLNSGGILDKIVGGWTLSTIGTFQTGFPLTISQTDSSGSQGGGQRPIRNIGVDPRTPGDSTQSRLGGIYAPNIYLNKAAFTIAAPFQEGTMARNFVEVRTPGTRNFNASLGKTTRISEGVSLTLRIEANNATNTPRFSGPNTSLSSAAFGQITSQTGFARQIQWMARVHW